jgi:hypothetical protein
VKAENGKQNPHRKIMLKTVKDRKVIQNRRKQYAEQNVLEPGTGDYGVYGCHGAPFG